MNKEMLKKADMPPAKGAADPMLDLEDMSLEDEAASEGEPAPQEKMEKSGSFADASDEDLLDELKKRGYDVEDSAGLPSNEYGDEQPEMGSEGPKPDKKQPF